MTRRAPMTRTAPMTRRRFVLATALLTVLVAVVQSAWALTVPALRGPDEPHHLNSIVRLADGGGWPAPGDARLREGMFVIGEEAGLLLPGAEGIWPPFQTVLTPTDPSHTEFAEVDVTPHAERSSLAVAPRLTDQIDQMTQHPPAYYGVAALVVKIGGLLEAPWDRAVVALRLMSMVMALPLVPALVLVARRLGASHGFALLTGLVPLAIPQVTAVSTAVTNDAPAIGAGALAMAALAIAALEPVSRRTVVLVGVTVGLALWTKGTMLVLGLPLILVFLLRRGPWLPRLGAVAGAGLLSQVVCPWWLLNLVRYGAIQPEGYFRPPAPGWDPSQADPALFLRNYFLGMGESFVANFGWLESRMPPAVWPVVLLVLAVLLVAGLVRLRRSWPVLVVLGAPVAGLLVVLVRASWATHLATSATSGLQGRYLFPFLVALAPAVVGAQRAGRWFGGVLAVAAVGMNLAGFLTYIGDSYPGDAGDSGGLGHLVDLDRAAEVVGVLRPHLDAALTASSVAALGCVALVVWVLARGGVRNGETPPPR